MADTPYSDSSSQSNWSSPYTQRLNEMLAPYQQMASQLQSPYATIRPNSWLATQHPRAASILDSGFLGAAMTPGPSGPEGVGGGISRAFQGLVGAQQFRRQQVLQSAMLPYQLLEPRLKAEDTLAQMDARRSQLMREQDYHELVTGHNARWAAQNEIDQQKADQAKFGRILSSPEERFAYARHPFKDPQNPTDEELGAVQKEYENIKGRTQHIPAGSYEEQIENMRRSPDPAVAAEGEARYKDHISTLQAGSGARITGAQDAPHPFDEAKMFMDNEYKAAHTKIPPLQNEEQYRKNLNPTKLGEYYSNPNAYQEYVDKYNMQKQQTDFNFAQYQKSGAWKNKIGYQEWLKNPTQTGPSEQPQPSNSGSNWTPRQ